MRLPGRRPRRALASLELALALPFLAFMAALIFKVAEADLGKTATVLHARHDGWKGQDQALEGEAAPLPDETLFRAALQLDGKPGHGVTDEKKTHTVRLPPIAPGTADVGSHLVVLQGTWDHRSVDFPDRPSLQPDGRVWTVIAVGALPPGATQVDPNAFNFGRDPFLKGLDVSKFHFQNLTSGDGKFAKVAWQFFEAANPSVKQGEEMLKILENPPKAAAQLLKTITNLDQLGDAIGKLGDAPDALDQLGGMLGDLKDGVDALQDIGVDSPALRQAADIGKKVQDISNVVRPVKDGLDKLKDALKLLKLGTP